jgi:hypothetical protein
MTQVPSERPQRGMGRRTRLFLAASLVAAVLVIGALAVTSALLFNKQNTGNEPQSGATPLSITLSSCASQPLPVLVDLCTHHLLTDLLQSRQMGKYVITLERAYLDMNQLLMTFRIFSPSTGRQISADLTDALVTTSQGQSFQMSAGAGNADLQVVQFSTPLVPAQTRTLQLQVEVKALRLPILKLPPAGTPLPQPSAVHGLATFDFTLKYHEGLVVTPHQTVTSNGSRVTLERVLISPSETILEGTIKGTFPGSPDYTFSLNAAGRSPDPTFSGFGSIFIVGFYDGLLGQHGTWTFEISLTSSTEGPWVFHFMVP